MITGDKVELRPVSLEDWKRGYEWRNDEETAKLEAGAYLYLASHVSMEQLEESYQTKVLKQDKRERGQFSIYARGEHPEHIGFIEYRETDLVSRRCTLGIGIGNKAYWGQGWGSDALKTLIRYMFRTMNLRRVQLETWSGNARAVRAYEKCGFVVEGRLRNHSYLDGQYYDMIVMGLLKEEFKF